VRPFEIGTKLCGNAATRTICLLEYITWYMTVTYQAIIHCSVAKRSAAAELASLNLCKQGGRHVTCRFSPLCHHPFARSLNRSVEYAFPFFTYRYSKENGSMTGGEDPEALRSGRVPPARCERASDTHPGFRSRNALRFPPICCAVSILLGQVIHSHL
jgi:hypothetical protein